MSSSRSERRCGHEWREGKEGSVADPSRSSVRRQDEFWEKQKKDAEMMERWRRMHGPFEDVTAGHAAQCKARLKAMADS